MKIIKFIKTNKIFVFPILSGILLILTYPPCNLSFLIWIALIPLFWFINLKIPPKKIFIGGFLVGILFFGKLFSWFFATYPFEWLGIIGQKDTILVFVLVSFIWLVQTIFLGLFIGAFAWFCKKFLDKSFKNKKISLLIIIPALWIILEYLRAWGFGILWLGKESFLGPHWTFGNLAYVLHNRTILIQLADLGGIYLISFLIILVNIILFLILKQCWRLSPAYRQAGFQHCAVLLGILILIGISWSVYGICKINQEETLLIDNSKRIALIQTNFLSSSEFNPYSKKEVFDTIIELFKNPKNIKENSEIIIEPEGFGIVNLTGSKKIAKHLLEDFYKPGQIFLENKKVIIDNKAKSRLFFYDLNQEKSIGFHDKLLLVPGGDYLPYWIKLLLNIYSFNTNYEKRLYAKGEKVEPVLVSLNVSQQGHDTLVKIGGTICSSIVSPDIQRKMTKKGAQFLVVVSSDAPFHGSKLLLSQNLAMSKLRAVENRRYFAQATNMGHSFLLNSKGEIKIKSKELGNKILFSETKIINKKTLYTTFGDWMIVIAGIIVFLGLIFKPKLSTPTS